MVLKMKTNFYSEWKKNQKGEKEVLKGVEEIYYLSISHFQGVPVPASNITCSCDGSLPALACRTSLYKSYTPLTAPHIASITTVGCAVLNSTVSKRGE
jgi:hypothetical protein